jgi:hypothetical protein
MQQHKHIMAENTHMWGKMAFFVSDLTPLQPKQKWWKCQVDEIGER